MEQLVASVAIALVLLVLVLRDVLVDHGRVVQATSSALDDARRDDLPDRGAGRGEAAPTVGDEDDLETGGEVAAA